MRLRVLLQTPMMTSNLEDLRTLPLHKVVGSSQLTKKIKIRCPFHSENTPSCTLFPTGGFKCYGCGASGNSIDFVAKLINSGDEKEDFKKALVELQNYI